jgi:pimeloyl-ACP methyl ester carboxylesterase
MRTLIAAFTVVSLFTIVPARAATVDGADIHWTAKGSGPAIIFVHGWTCDETSWDAQVPVLSRNHRVITIDLPGHGRSGAPQHGKYSMGLFARAIEAVRRDANVDTAVLVGHSMGGPVIRQYALMYPQRVAGLVLVDGLVLVNDNNATGGPPPRPMTGADGLKTREQMIRGMFGPSTTPENQQRILKMMLGTSEAAAAGSMAATRDRSKLTNDPVALPVLGIYADHSRLANREAMNRLYPGIEYREIPGTGHFVMMDKPAEFNDLLTAFVDRLKY